MTTQPTHPHAPEPEQVPRTYDGIVDALQGSRRMAFFREFGEAPHDQAEAVLRRWWCEAMLDTDPEADRTREAAVAGTLHMTTVEEVLARRKARGLPVG
ncbi:hypothetical protein [Streptomyces sp. UNOC14_S4]|uniref:hypothetical protein n=1 Tax=Streptomyces sp. UNOC14_S4 TaxID=2872340 RepID=UPI001E28B180|nr:hypothetical protein [Streptomyces sp. UNOC14_S4]MCC3768552.1 hypothetical protein [Streptomyces sp. UNOC14_S4]